MKMPKKKPSVDPNDPRVDEFIDRAATVRSGADGSTKQRSTKRSYRPKGGYVRATYDIPAELHDAVKRAALDSKQPMRDLVVEWIEAGLKNQ